MARKKRWFGIDRDNNEDFRGGYPIQDLGFKFHMNDISSALGIGNMPHIKSAIEDARENADVYYKKLSDLRYVKLLDNDYQSRSSYWLFTIRAMYRDQLSEHLKETGIQTSLVHHRNDTHPIFKNFKSKANALPVLDEVSKDMLCLPVGWWMTPHKIRKIVDRIKDFYVHRKG